ncbi:Ribosomal protein L7/L12 domain protein, partial [Ostertagia ostertagi]
LPLNEGAPAPLPSEDHTPSPKVAALVEEIANLSLLDVADLNRALKKRLNIADQPMMHPGMMMAAQAPAAASTEAASSSEPDVPQKMTFSVKLTKFDDAKKIALIKEIRTAISGLNLVQAKKFVETAPVVVKEDMGKAEAEELKATLEKAGATVEIV